MHFPGRLSVNDNFCILFAKTHQTKYITIKNPYYSLDKPPFPLEYIRPSLHFRRTKTFITNHYVHDVCGGWTLTSAENRIHQATPCLTTPHLHLIKNIIASFRYCRFRSLHGEFIYQCAKILFSHVGNSIYLYIFTKGNTGWSDGRRQVVLILCGVYYKVLLYIGLINKS